MEFAALCPGPFQAAAAATCALRCLTCCLCVPAFSLLQQVMYPDIEEVQGGDMSPQLLGWIDVADVMRAFLQRERCCEAASSWTDGPLLLWR